MNKNALLGLLCIFTVSCASDTCQWVKIVDESGMPVQGVDRIPKTFLGRNSRLSDKKGGMYVPSSGVFHLHKPGYKTCWVDLRAEKLGKDQVFVLEKETRSEEERIKEDGIKADELLRSGYSK